jgi:hypothetical protein
MSGDPIVLMLLLQQSAHLALAVCQKIEAEMEKCHAIAPSATIHH